jgi:hypothetical protein
MEGWKDGRMEEWKGGRMKGWKNGWRAPSPAFFHPSILPIFHSSIPLGTSRHSAANDLRLSMKDARNFEDKERLGHPTSQLYAIVQNRELLDEIVQSLRENGFTADSMGVLRGKQDAQKLDEATGRRGLLTKMAKMWPEFGDRDATYLEQYRLALLRDEAVIGIVVQGEAELAKARQILKSAGARFQVHFGQFVVEVLEA